MPYVGTQLHFSGIDVPYVGTQQHFSGIEYAMCRNPTALAAVKCNDV